MRPPAGCGLQVAAHGVLGWGRPWVQPLRRTSSQLGCGRAAGVGEPGWDRPRGSKGFTCDAAPSEPHSRAGPGNCAHGHPCPALGSDVIRPRGRGWVGNLPVGVRRIGKWEPRGQRGDLTQSVCQLPAGPGPGPLALRPVFSRCPRRVCPPRLRRVQPVPFISRTERPHSRRLAGHFLRASPRHPGGQRRGPGPGPGRSSPCCFSRTPGLPQGQGTAPQCPLVGSPAGQAWKEKLAGPRHHVNAET